MKIRDVVFSVEDISVEEKMWAKLPSYYYGDKFVRIIPFKDHINIEAEGFAGHMKYFDGCKFTPKGIKDVNQNKNQAIFAKYAYGMSYFFKSDTVTSSGLLIRVLYLLFYCGYY